MSPREYDPCNYYVRVFARMLIVMLTVFYAYITYQQPFQYILLPFYGMIYYIQAVICLYAITNRPIMECGTEVDYTTVSYRII